MNKGRALEVLKDLKDYIAENWDVEEYEKNTQALDFAIDIIESSAICGKMELDGKSYLISR